MAVRHLPRGNPQQQTIQRPAPDDQQQSRAEQAPDQRLPLRRLPCITERGTHMRAQPAHALRILGQRAQRVDPERATERRGGARGQPRLELVVALRGDLRRHLAGILVEQLRLLDLRVQRGLHLVQLPPLRGHFRRLCRRALGGHGSQYVELCLQCRHLRRESGCQLPCLVLHSECLAAQIGQRHVVVLALERGLHAGQLRAQRIQRLRRRGHRLGLG